MEQRWFKGPPKTDLTRPCESCGKVGHTSDAHNDARAALRVAQQGLAAIRRSSIAVEEWLRIGDELLALERERATAVRSELSRTREKLAEHIHLKKTHRSGEIL